jgi:hypothetical protein
LTAEADFEARAQEVQLDSRNLRYRKKRQREFRPHGELGEVKAVMK